MKLNYKLKKSFEKNLQDISKKNGHETITKIIQKILDVNKTSESLKEDIETLKVLANSDNVQKLEANFILAKCYELGIGVEKNGNQAAKHYQYAADKGHLVAVVNLALCYFDGNGVNKDLNHDKKLMSFAAENGLAIAQRNLGLAYLQNTYGVKDVDVGLTWLRKAAEQGDADAQSQLGCCYLEGNDVNKDEKYAIEMLHLAAKNGNLLAQAKLGTILLDRHIPGIGDRKYGVELLQSAVDNGDADGHYSLGFHCYFKGVGVEKNVHCALLLLQNAQALGHQRAKSFLKDVTERGAKFPTLDTAADHFDKISKAGDITALKPLALCYHQGFGVSQDLKKASELYNTAISKGINCYWELFACYRSQAESESNSELLKKYYEALDNLTLTEDNNALANNDHAKAASLLAYLYERGNLYIDRNVFIALKYYKIANKIEPIYANSKIAHYTPLNNLKEVIKNEFQDGPAGIIAEYVYDPEVTVQSIQP